MILQTSMWHELGNGIIMTEECNLYGMTINNALSEFFEEFQRKAYSNLFRTVKRFGKAFQFCS